MFSVNKCKVWKGKEIQIWGQTFRKRPKLRLGQIFEAFRAKIEAGPTLRPGKINNMRYFYNSQAHDNTFLDKKINEIKIEKKYFFTRE